MRALYYRQNAEFIKKYMLEKMNTYVSLGEADVIACIVSDKIYGRSGCCIEEL